jgi:hypothetical protein
MSKFQCQTNCLTVQHAFPLSSLFVVVELVWLVPLLPLVPSPLSLFPPLFPLFPQKTVSQCPQRPKPTTCLPSLSTCTEHHSCELGSLCVVHEWKVWSLSLKGNTQGSEELSGSSPNVVFNFESEIKSLVMSYISKIIALGVVLSGL